MQLDIWADRDGTGVAFDSNSGFIVPNGAMRSPDASWVRSERLITLTAEQKQRFLSLCPDFVIEAKMREYLENGARFWAGSSIPRSARSAYTSPETSQSGS